MPEGPEIKRTADCLADALAGQHLRQVRFAVPGLQAWEDRLAGTRVLSVMARGKALLTRFDNGMTLYTHNQLYGRWEVVEGRRLPSSRRRLRLVLGTRSHLALLYSATEIEMLDEEALAAHPYLSRLGPELLDPGVDAAQVKARLLHHPRRALSGLLQDQSVLAGIGNYLCCEILHVAGLHPRRRLADLASEQVDRLAATCLALTRRSYLTAGITNDLYRAECLRAEGHTFEERRFHVYRREGLACYRCGGEIVKARIGGQPIYFCPGCQPLSEAP